MMRHELKKRNIKDVKVVYSTEGPIRARTDGALISIPGSIAFVPSVVGLIICSEVINLI